MLKSIITLLIYLNIGHALLAETNSTNFDFSEEEEVGKWPVRLLFFEFEAFQAKQETDIANEFAFHSLEKTKKETFYQHKIAFNFFDFFDLHYSYSKQPVHYILNDSFQPDREEFHLREVQYGLGFLFKNFRFEIGLGDQSTFSFLETDTSEFYYFQMDTKYYFSSLQINIPTRLFVELHLKFSAKLYRNISTDTYEITEGTGREWFIGLNKNIFGVNFTPFASYGYENFLMTHKFFGLNNEMAIKQHRQRFGLRMTYFY